MSSIPLYRDVVCCCSQSTVILFPLRFSWSRLLCSDLQNQVITRNLNKHIRATDFSGKKITLLFFLLLHSIPMSKYDQKDVFRKDNRIIVSVWSRLSYSCIVFPLSIQCCFFLLKSYYS